MLAFLLCSLDVVSGRLVVAMIVWRRMPWNRHRVYSASAVCYQTVGRKVREAMAS
jgi:hypothetical protein